MKGTSANERVWRILEIDKESTLWSDDELQWIVFNEGRSNEMKWKKWN